VALIGTTRSLRSATIGSPVFWKLVEAIEGRCGTLIETDAEPGVRTCRRGDQILAADREAVEVRDVEGEERSIVQQDVV